jgi:hypothetical protein
VFKFNVYKKPISFFIIGFSTIFLTPVIYYDVMKGVSYRIFDDSTLLTYELIGILSCIFVLLYICIFDIHGKYMCIKKKSFIFEKGKKTIFFELYLQSVFIRLVLKRKI